MTINNIADRAHGVRDAADALDRYADESEHLRNEAIARIWHETFDLAVDKFLHLPWGEKGLPPERLSMVQGAIEQYARKHSAAFARIELENPRFLKYAVEVLSKAHKGYRGMRDADEASKKEDEGEYLQALAALVQAAVAIVPEGLETLQAPTILAAKNVEIWSDNVRAAWIVVDANRQSTIQDADLKAIIEQSRWLHHLMKEKDDLEARRQ